jgi:serine/threonine protein kinase
LVNSAGLLLKLEDIQLGDVIGEGAYSLVRQGWLQGKLVAVKQLKTLRSSTIKAFMREINALRVASQSPHVIKLIGACTKNLKLCIVTPYLKGGSIHDLIYKKHVQFTREQAFRLAIETASGMQYLHENRIIHRDLTPTNILLHPNENGKSFIADFGISLFKEEKVSIISAFFSRCLLTDYSLRVQCLSHPKDIRDTKLLKSAESKAIPRKSTPLCSEQCCICSFPTKDLTKELMMPR